MLLFHKLRVNKTRFSEGIFKKLAEKTFLVSLSEVDQLKKNLSDERWVHGVTATYGELGAR